MKKHKLLFLIVTFVTSISLNAQNFEWAKSIDGSNSVSSIISDEYENIYATGNFQNAITFNTSIGVMSLTAVGSSDIFISKMNASGEFEWVKQIGGIYSESGNSIALDDDGNIYVTGSFQDKVDFNPSTGIADTMYLDATAGYVDIFVLKLDSNGTFKWAKQIGGTAQNNGHGIIADSESSVYITGFFNGAVDFDPDTNSSYVLNSSGGDDAFICKLDSSGNFGWVIQIGGTGVDRGETIKIDSYNNLYAAGGFSGTVDFDPGVGDYNLTSLSGSLNPYFIKLSNTGNLIWAKSFESPYWAYSQQVEVDTMGNVYCAGGYQVTIDVNPGLGIADTFLLNSGGSYISKLDSSGEFIWAKQFQGSCKIYSIDLDENSNVYTTGDFNSIVDFDPDEDSSFKLVGYDSDVFISKLDSSGNFCWAAQIAGNQTFEVGYSIHVKNSNVYTAGIFTGTVDFDPDTTNEYWITSTTGGNNSFIQKMNQCSLDTSVTKVGITLTANVAGATYRWLDCNNSYSVIQDATYQSFTATLNGSYAVEITQNNCVDTSACYAVTTVGILENTFGNEIIVYPNPTDGFVKIDLGEELNEFSVSIYDVIGKLISQSSYKETQEFEINLNVQTGIYFLTINSGNERPTITIKLVKN